MKPKNKKPLYMTISSLTSSLAISIPMAIVTTNYSILNKKDEQKEYLESGEKTFTNETIRINNHFEKKLELKKRNPNNQYYETKLEKMEGFKYPGYDFDYKSIKNNDDKTKIRRLVLDERTDFIVDQNNTNNLNKYAKYSDSRFIKNEIKNNKLKKHPAVKNFYINNVLDTTKSLTKGFSINSSNWGPSTLGLYAPAGEVVTITFSEETYQLLQENKWNDIVFEINNNYWDCKEPSDNDGSVSKRYPYLFSSFRVNVNDIDPTTKSFKIGTPFGGGITIKLTNKLTIKNNLGLNQFMNIDFKVEGAVEQFHYVHGVTTEEDWFNQIERVKNKEITAPILSANSNFFSFQMQFYDTENEKQLANNTSLDSLIYPKEIFDKWYDFMFLSFYGARNDITSELPKCEFKFAEEIWQGAAAWGGNNWFACPPSWAVDSFFINLDSVRAANWGLLHETNHNYQVNEALFKRRTHGETNQVNMVNLAILNDESRWRNPKNLFEGNKITGPGGSVYVNSYSIIEYINKIYNDSKNLSEAEIHNKTGEYAIYAMLIHKLGAFNYLDYIRWDQLYHPNTTSNWNGLDEIKALSEFFQMNFYEAFADYSKNWNESDGLKWPKSYEDANQSEKIIIDKLRKYPAFDFVGNFYSAGSFNYDFKTKEFKYNDDYSPPYEIPAGKPYIFEFDKFINSTNLNFSWDNLKIESNSKLGASIEIDQTNNKRLIYKPNISKINEIDEFIISIEPKHNQTSINYQPKYLWKIKVRQNAKGPLVSYYSDFPSDINKEYNNLFDVEWPKKENNFECEWISNGKNTEINVFDTQNTQPVRYWFNFVAPQDGTYVFKGKWDDLMGLWINGIKENINGQEWYNGTLKELKTITLKKGEIINIKYVVINNAGPGNIELKSYLKDNNIEKEISIYENSIVPYYNQFNDKYTIIDIMYKKEYQYQRRKLDYMKLHSGNYSTNQSSFNAKFPEISINDYDISYDKNQGAIYTDNNNSNDFKLINEILKDNKNNNKYLEYWKYGSASGQPPAGKEEDIIFEYDVTLKESKLIKSIYFNNPNKGWWGSTYPEKLTIFGYKNNNENPEIILDTTYVNKNLNISSYDLEKPGEYIKLKMKFMAPKTRNYKGLTLGSFTLSQAKKEELELGFSYNINNGNFKKTGGWITQSNNIDINASSVGGNYIVSKSTNSTIEFTLKNTNGFRIIGQKTIVSSLFDVYINNKLIETVDTKSNSGVKLFNQTLFDYWTSENKILNVKIVQKNSNPLYINYVSTYNIKTKLEII